MTGTLSELSLEDLATDLEQQIVRKTRGRIYDLRVLRLCVAADGGRVVVRGRAGSYHIRQLALSAVLETFESWGLHADDVDLQIEVNPHKAWYLEAHDPVAVTISNATARGDVCRV